MFEIYDYKKFMENPKRKESPEVDFGCWWGLTRREDNPFKWRVSWIEKTGELYAYCYNKDIAIVLGIFKTREEVEKRMQGWSNFENQVLKTFFDIPDKIISDLNKLGILW